jgi:nucleotide-binding universal stress UspA family protein
LKRARSLKLRTILVPVDFSKRSRAALTYAVRLARDVDASLVVLHVLDRLLASGRFESSRLRQLKSSSRKEAEEQLQELRSELIESGVRTRLFLRYGPAADVIVAFALKVKADLIIVGSEGRIGLSRMLIGSVAERVVRHASCSVLVVR